MISGKSDAARCLLLLRASPELRDEGGSGAGGFRLLVFVFLTKSGVVGFMLASFDVFSSFFEKVCWGGTHFHGDFCLVGRFFWCFCWRSAGILISNDGSMVSMESLGEVCGFC